MERDALAAPITAAVFTELLRKSCPEAIPIVDEHLAFHEEILLHLLVADIRRFCIERFEVRDDLVLRRGLAVVAQGLTDGDDYVENAVSVSFVEDTGW